MKLQSLHTFLLAFCAFSVFSCSDNDDTIEEITPPIPTPENLLLVKKITQTTYFGSMDTEVSVADFTYEDGQLASTQTHAGAYIYGSSFHYDGAKVTSVDYTQNGYPDGLTTFYYNGDALNYTLSGESQDERTNYTFSNGNVASAFTYYPDGPDAQLLQSSSYVYENRNVVEELRSSYFQGTETSRLTYTYDGKNNPFKGLNPYLKLVMSNEGFDGLSAGNPLTRTVYSPVGETTPNTFYYDLEYNAENYPTSIKRYTSGDTLLSETVIEYQ